MLKEVLKDLTDATADEHSQQAATSAGEELKSRHGTSQTSIPSRHVLTLTDQAWQSSQKERRARTMSVWRARIVSMKLA
ncbi:hypothetical protein WJX82_004780 [Trebouxia sp. C0006]